MHSIILHIREKKYCIVKFKECLHKLFELAKLTTLTSKSQNFVQFVALKWKCYIKM